MERRNELTDHDMVNQLYIAATYGNGQLRMEQLMENIDISELTSRLIKSTDVQDIAMLIKALNFIYNETTLDSPVSDELYDELVERYKDAGGMDSVIGTDRMTMDSEELHVSHHKYPELRGSLSKIHFIYSDEIPNNDSRKSLEMYYDTIQRSLINKGKEIPASVTACCDLKYDGVSQVFECEYDKIAKVLTRYKVTENLGKDVTAIYRVGNFKLDIPDCFKALPKYGVKTECYMKKTAFEKFQQDYGNKGCNRRTAVTSIMNKSEELISPDDIQYISVQPFQIATTIKVEEPIPGWTYCGIINDRYQYIHTEGAIFKNVLFNNKGSFLTSIQSTIPEIRELANQQEIPIDGVVITLLNSTIIDTVGRKDDINQFQIAYKLSAGIDKTTVTGVTFQVGPITGAITPVLQVFPVTINGATISNATLSNVRKMKSLNLHIGDEVVITYDIIPKVSKDSTCKESTGDAINAPTNCPICGEPLQYNEMYDLCYCGNPNCKSKIPGKILNYVGKLGIMGFGKQTINDLVNAGVLHGIEDLYRMPYFKDQILAIPGYGAQSYINLYKCVSARTAVYPHELIGALGINGLGLKRMHLICQHIPFTEFINDPKGCYDDLVRIPGVGANRAKDLTEGLVEHHNTLLYLAGILTIKEYPNEDYEYAVTFSGIRDADFEKFLESNRIQVSDGWNNSIKLVIVPDGEHGETTKIKKAKERGVGIMAISTAKKRFNYTKRGRMVRNGEEVTR